DTSPMWAPDGKALYYVTEQTGRVANVVKLDLFNREPPASAPAPQPVTQHADDAVRRARISGNGEWIVYECGADLYVVSTHGGPPRKLAVEVHADDKSNAERLVTVNAGATDYAPSPDERHVALVVHGELFL